MPAVARSESGIKPPPTPQDVDAVRKQAESMGKHLTLFLKAHQGADLSHRHFGARAKEMQTELGSLLTEIHDLRVEGSIGVLRSMNAAICAGEHPDKPQATTSEQQLEELGVHSKDLSTLLVTQTPIEDGEGLDFSYTLERLCPQHAPNQDQSRTQPVVSAELLERLEHSYAVGKLNSTRGDAIMTASGFTPPELPQPVMEAYETTIIFDASFPYPPDSTWM
ncbi:MAG: hypothetical protein HY344_03770 [Candidatus Levybacteria bacterium]|nr:hypothetical protein [Candidatus Levybacteria bacterium]